MDDYRYRVTLTKDGIENLGRTRFGLLPVPEDNTITTKDFLLCGGQIIAYEMMLMGPEDNLTYFPHLALLSNIFPDEDSREKTMILVDKELNTFNTFINETVLKDDNLYTIIGLIPDGLDLKMYHYFGCDDVFVRDLNDPDFEPMLSYKLASEYLPKVVEQIKRPFAYPGRYLDMKSEETAKCIPMSEEEWDEILHKIIIGLKLRMYNSSEGRYDEMIEDGGLFGLYMDYLER